MNSVKEIQSSTLYLTLLIMLPCIYLLGLGDTPFYSVGEPREAVVAQTMYIEGSLLNPYRFDGEFATKPPLLHWGMLGFAHLTGAMDELASRLPSAVAALITLTLWFFFLVSETKSRNTAFLAILILTSSPEWYRHATSARVDMLLSCAITLALIALYYWCSRPTLLNSFLAIAFLSAGVLCKGPVAVAIPAAITTLWLWYNSKLTFKNISLLALISALSLAPLAFWYYLIYKEHGAAILHIFLSENVLRFLGNMDSVENPHEHGPLYLFGSLFVGTAPWSIFTLIAAIFLYRSKALRLPAKESDERGLVIFCLISLSCFLGFYSIPSSKRAAYLLPAYPALAFLMSYLFHRLRERYEGVTRTISMVLVSALLTLWIVLLLYRFSFINISSFFKREKDLLLLSLIDKTFSVSTLEFSHVAPIIVFGGFLLYMLWSKGSKLTGATALLCLTCYLIRAELLTPYAKALTSRDFVQREMSDHNLRELAMFNDRMYAEVFYARALSPNIRLEHYDYDEDDPNVLLSTDSREDFEDHTDLKTIYEHISPNPVEKPNRKLELAIRDLSDNTPSARAHK